MKKARRAYEAAREAERKVEKRLEAIEKQLDAAKSETRNASRAIAEARWGKEALEERAIRGMWLGLDGECRYEDMEDEHLRNAIRKARCVADGHPALPGLLKELQRRRGDDHGT